jgi:mannose-1-phosphate guanylyltransferase
MEHAEDLRCVPLSAGWSDVGSWRSLLDQRPTGEECFVRGDVIALDCQRTVAIGDGVTVAVVGTRNLAVIATRDAVLAIDLDHSQDVRKVVATLADNDRDNLL